MVDRLEEMFKLQRGLQIETFGVDLKYLSHDQRVQYIKDMVLAATDELHEALGETSWKPWATKKFINEEAYHAELIDAWHFFMNLMLATGRSPADLADVLYEGYMLKRQINIDRQARGYDGVSMKCSECGRALDDPAVACWRLNDQGWCAAKDLDVNYLGPATEVKVIPLRSTRGPLPDSV